ncbi:hypothetical protein D3C78_901460 [compost metagenome]
MKHTLIDNLWVLLRKHHLPWIDLIQARNGLARGQRLARRITGRRDVSSVIAAIDE